MHSLELATMHSLGLSMMGLLQSVDGLSAGNKLFKDELIGRA